MKFTPNSNDMYFDSLTRVTKLDISLEDNFTNTLSNHSMSDVTLLTDNNSNYKESEDSNMPVDSLDNNNKTQPVTNNNYHKKHVKRMLRFNRKCCADKPDNDRTKELSYCNSKYKTAPLASSTIIDLCDSVMADDVNFPINAFVPSSSSTMINEFIPCASSAMVKITQQFSVLQIDKKSYSSIETWSIKDNEETIPLQQHYIGRHIRGRNSTCFSRDLLSTIAASTICRDEFSLDMHYSDAPFINKNSKLPRTSTVTQFNHVTEQQPTCSIKVEDCKKRKQPQKLLKLKQVMKNVKKGLIKKTKTFQSKQVKPDDDKQCAPVQINDKQAIVRKLHRFRESFRRKDIRNLRTLVTL